MARFRSLKTKIRDLLSSDGWRSSLDLVAAEGQGAAGPLMGTLLFEHPLRLRAAIALGRTAAFLQKSAPDAARDVVRRLNWRMSEESGNIGWGVPEAVGEVLAACPPLARDFHRIFFSTILDLGFDDNYVDNDALRRSCYFAIGRFCAARPDLGEEVRILLRKGLDDADPECRGMAAWALSRLPRALDDLPPLRRLAEARVQALCLLTDGDETVLRSPSDLALDALRGTRPVCS